jgi:methyl-accepting chemotaxis protein
MNSVHGQVERSSARDVVPLADLQQLTDDFQAYTVHGLVVGLSAVTGQLEAVQQQLQLKAASKEATAADLKALAAHIPADLAGRVATISADWDDMVTKDAAYQAAAAANSPDARAASQAATAAYLKLEQDVNGLTDTLLADEAASREAIGARFAAARTITLALLAVGVLLAVGLGILLARDIRNPGQHVRGRARSAERRPVPGHGADPRDGRGGRRQRRCDDHAGR